MPDERWLGKHVGRVDVLIDCPDKGSFAKVRVFDAFDAGSYETVGTEDQVRSIVKVSGCGINGPCHIAAVV